MSDDDEQAPNSVCFLHCHARIQPKSKWWWTAKNKSNLTEMVMNYGDSA